MIVRQHIKGDARSEAIYSDCENYRFSLSRTWNSDGGRALFVMLNPSTATERQNDPTVERCERRARALGFGAFRVTNIFAWRATDPKELRSVPDPVGGENDQYILRGVEWASAVICAWGTHGELHNRGKAVEALLRARGSSLMVLGLTKDGHPKHPLYISYREQPQVW